MKIRKRLRNSFNKSEFFDSYLYVKNLGLSDKFFCIFRSNEEKRDSVEKAKIPMRRSLSVQFIFGGLYRVWYLSLSFTDVKERLQSIEVC
jgi:hypothetical protein